MSRTDENATQFALLGLLYREPMTGYAIKNAFDESVKYFWNVSYGQIYPELKRLVAKGYATVREERSSNRPARKVYRITEVGRRALRVWLSEPPAARPARSEMALKLCFGDIGRIEDQIEHLRGFGAEHAGRLRAFREIERAAEADPAHPEEIFSLLTLRMGIAVSGAMVQWSQESIRTLQDIGDTNTKPKRQSPSKGRRKGSSRGRQVPPGRNKASG